jgi:hypothetical protein
MLRLDYAEQTSPENGATTDTRPAPTAGRELPGLPGWRIALRRAVLFVVERALGQCLGATPTRGALVLVAVVGLLAVITVTLSVGNALLVLLAGVIMRISCEYRSR